MENANSPAGHSCFYFLNHTYSGMCFCDIIIISIRSDGWKVKFRNEKQSA